MLPLKYRIKKQSLPVVLKKNKVFSADFYDLRVHHRLNDNPDYNKPAKLAVVVANKVIPSSVKRHLIKRRIHTVLEKKWSCFGVNIDLIIQIKDKKILELSLIDLEKSLLGLLKSVKILKS